MSVRTLKSGALKPIRTSAVVNSSTTGSPFLSAMSSGTNSNLRAVTRITLSRGCARAAAPNAAPARAAIPAASTRRRPGLIASGLRHRVFGDPVRGLFDFRIHFAETESPVGLRRIPGHGLALGLRSGRDQREDQRLRRVVRDMPGHLMVLLVDVAVEHGHVAIRHQELERLGAVARRPVPLRHEIEQRPVSEDDDGRVLVLLGEIRLDPRELGLADARRGVANVVDGDEVNALVIEAVMARPEEFLPRLAVVEGSIVLAGHKAHVPV